MTEKTVTLEFHEGVCEFCAGHFTIFSATEREWLHGHNYSVQASIATHMHEPGIAFDYAIIKNKLKSICGPLDRRFLLPSQNPYLKIEASTDYYHAIFNGEKIPFLKKDVVLLPIANTTIEALSQWFLEQLLADLEFMDHHGITAITIRLFNGREQNAMTHWERPVVTITT